MSLKDVITSGIAVAIAELITMPISTIKTNYQTNLNYKNIINTIKDIYLTRGIFGFYSATLAGMASQIVSISSKYTIYQLLKKYRKTEDHNFKNNFINGVISGICGSILSHPLDVIKITQQRNESFKNNIKNEGIYIIYRGYSKNLTKTIGLSGLLFPTYDFYKSKFNNSIIAALLTSLTTTSILHPIDLLKTRHIANQKLFLGFNIMNYYRGISINLIRILPHFTIVMGLTEYLKKNLKF